MILHWSWSLPVYDITLVMISPSLWYHTGHDLSQSMISTGHDLFQSMISHWSWSLPVYDINWSWSLPSSHWSWSLPVYDINWSWSLPFYDITLVMISPSVWYQVVMISPRTSLTTLKMLHNDRPWFQCVNNNPEHCINTLRPREYGRSSTDDNVKRMFLNGNDAILTECHWRLFLRFHLTINHDWFK